MQQQIEALTQQVTALPMIVQQHQQQQQRQPHPNPRFVEEEEDVVNDEEVGNPFARDLPRGRRPVQTVSRWWEVGLKIDIPEFKGGSQAEEFLGWLFAVEKVLDFKDVPEDKRVALVATWFWGRAIAWWQQIKLT
ncbi:uncharacterized protein LOC130788284 [Actinidia eriantha]|uniref:uncharacterized protein LOC130788284 n=1 Tax=Actinidia eriantha TaxID=165200 RepID=UPI00258FFD67|nr:uncharacterized protein LOC130788284 [Actinidia eriantha]